MNISGSFSASNRSVKKVIALALNRVWRTPVGQTLVQAKHLMQFASSMAYVSGSIAPEGQDSTQMLHFIQFSSS